MKIIRNKNAASEVTTIEFTKRNPEDKGVLRKKTVKKISTFSEK